MHLIIELECVFNTGIIAKLIMSSMVAMIPTILVKQYYIVKLQTWYTRKLDNCIIYTLALA